LLRLRDPEPAGVPVRLSPGPNQVKLRNVAGKPEGSGSVFVTYETGEETRVDHTDIEQVKLLK
jgi:hypothetical protein